MSKRYKKYLEDLEKQYAAGQIAPRIYERLKAEYESRLKEAKSRERRRTVLGVLALVAVVAVLVLVFIKFVLPPP